MRTSFIVPVAALATLATAAHAGYVNTFRDTLNIPFSAGSGNSNTNFSISRFTETNSNVVELGIKAKQRFFGDANVGGSGSLYAVQPGFSPVSGSNPTPDPPRAWWNFDFSINLGNRTFNNTSVFLDITNNVNSQFMSIDISGLLIANSLGGLSIIQDSQNLGFGAFAALGFNANAVGTYAFSLRAESFLDSGVVLGDASMLVSVVPLPTSAMLASASLLALAARRRR